MRYSALLLMLTILIASFLLPTSSAHAQAPSFRRWLDDGKTFTCTDMGGSITVGISQQNVEFSNLPVDAEFTINYIKNGVIATDGPFTVEQTSGTRNYGSFATSFPSYPLTFEFRLDTLIGGQVVYQSSLIINCSADSTGPVTPVNVDLGSPGGPRFRRWLDDGKVFTCTDVGGSISVGLNQQNVEFSNLPVDAEFTINYIKNGVIATDGPFTVEQTSGTRNYGSFATSFPSYPLTFEFRLDTLIGGQVVYKSSLSVSCSADATVPVMPVNVDLSGTSGGGAVAPAAGCDQYVQIPAGAVGGQFVNYATVYWAPGSPTYPAVTIDPGLTYLVAGQDESGQYRKILLSCKWVWVESGTVGPNWQAPWNGMPLPTTVVE